MKKLLVGLLLFNLISLQAKEVVWFEGSIVLRSREVLTGEISLEPAHDLVLYRSRNNKVDVYPAHTIESLYFYDDEANINRRFLALQQRNERWKKYQLYEIVVQGEVSVLRRQKNITAEDVSDAYGFQYFVKQHDQLISLYKFRRKIYPGLVEDTGDLLTMFVAGSTLNPNEEASAIRIIEFYNQQVRAGYAMVKP